MALKLNERYPGRYSNPSADYPQGSFKNRTNPTAKDGSYLEQDWANDKEGFFQSLISAAGVVPSGAADKVGASQYYDSLLTVIYAAARKTPVLNDTGTAGAYAAVNTPPLSSLPSTGYMQRVKIANLNPGASTYAPDGLAAKPIYGLGLQPLQGGELPAGIAVLMYLVQAGVNGGNGAWIIIESLGGASQVAKATKSQHAVQFSQISGVVGDSRNLAASLAVAGTSLSWTASELIVESALGGLRYCLPNFNKTLNISGTGAGGMDTGSAPVSGHVAIYAIYNPITDTSALLGVNATAAAQPDIYGGVNMPAGYTASALISVWITNASSQFVIGTQAGRSVSMPSTNIFSSGALNASVTSTAATILPKNAKSTSGNLTVSASAASALSLAVYASSVSVGQQINNSSIASGGQNVVPFNKLPITTQQVVYMTSAILSGSGQNYIISLTSYEF